MINELEQAEKRAEVTLRRMLATAKMHQKAYRAYSRAGNVEHARQARYRMLTLYLRYRVMRDVWNLVNDR